MPDPFTDEDRAHIERLADTYICEATTEDVLARALSYIDHLEGALEAADELARAIDNSVYDCDEAEVATRVLNAYRALRTSERDAG